MKLVIERPAWVDEAVCAQVGPALHFPGPDERGVLLSAQQVCALCPVKPECFLDSLVHDDRDGVWAGLSAGARDRMVQGKIPLPEWADERHEAARAEALRVRQATVHLEAEERREATVSLTLAGVSAAEIGERLGVDPNTIRRYRREAGVEAPVRVARAPRPNIVRKDPTPREKCGTERGYVHHRLNNEYGCEPCKRAHGRYRADQRAKAKEARRAA